MATLSRTIERWKVWWWLKHKKEVVLLYEQDLHQSQYSVFSRRDYLYYAIGVASWNKKPPSLLYPDGSWTDGLYQGTYRFVTEMKPWKKPLEINKRAKYGDVHKAREAS